MAFSRHGWLPFLIATLSLSTAAQIKNLTHEQYWAALGDAYHSGEKFYPVRQTAVERTYIKGKVESLTKETDEWTANDVERKISQDTFNNRLRRIEVIWIGGVYYCRRNGGKWRIEPRNCSLVKHWGLAIQESETYSSEETDVNGEKVKVLHSYSAGRDLQTGPMAFLEDFVWIGKDGLIIRQETTRGLVKPRSVMWSRSEVFNYRAKAVNIERPIF
jgi:hypothetical protein